MLTKLSWIDLIKAIQTNVETNTSLKCYDQVPENTEAPFYFVEGIGKRSTDTKTMFCETYSVWIHAIAERSIEVYQLIQKLEESLTEDIELPECYQLIMQTGEGVSKKIDETEEHHAVLQFDFKVSYGFKIK